MTNLTEKLKRDHANIIGALKMAGDLEIDAESRKSRLIAVDHALARHMRLEDERLYPVLREAGKTDPYVRQTMIDFAEDLLAFAVAVSTCLDEYICGKWRELASDFRRLNDLITSRFSREEEVLYSLYDINQVRRQNG